MMRERAVMTLTDLRQAAELLAPGATVTLRREDLLAAFQTEPDSRATPVQPASGVSWRERIWTVPDETRLGVEEVAQAMGRPRSWVYRAVAKSQGVHRLPAKRLAGELVFTAGDVRNWIEREESQP